MKITSTSWHFRFNSKIQSDRFTDKARCGRFTTCSYIRTSIYSVVQALWFTFLACFSVIAIACVIGCAIWVPFSIFFLNGTPPGEALTAASVVWGLIAFGLLVMTWKYVEPRFVAPAIKEPNVFIQAIKDHHGKFCTRVEVV